MIKEVAAIASVLFLLIPAAVTAQAEGIRILSIFLGEMPRACVAALTPQCFSCLIFTKFFPLLFFVAIFFLIFFYTIKLMRPTLPRTPIEQLMGERPSLEAVEIKVIIILSLIFSIIILKVTAIATLLSWLIFVIFLALFIFGVMLARSVFRIGGVISNLASIIILIIILAVFWSYIGVPLSSAIGDWSRIWCLGE